VLSNPTIAIVRGSAPPEPVTRPEFARSHRIVIRASVVGGSAPDVTAQLLDRTGRVLTPLPVSTFGGRCEVALALGNLGRGDYVVRLSARRGDDFVDHYVPLRVSR
jgi:hypothetical protein